MDISIFQFENGHRYHKISIQVLFHRRFFIKSFFHQYKIQHNWMDACSEIFEKQNELDKFKQIKVRILKVKN